MIDYLALAPLALLLDRLLGEPSRFHPLVGFGNLVQRIESRMNSGNALFFRGVVAWLVAVTPFTLIVYLLDSWMSTTWGFLFGAICGWLTIGWQSLREHGQAVLQALTKNNLDDARLKTSYLVSRDTTQLDEVALSRATIESLLENGCDAIFAALFWLFILGPTGVVLYRLSNTLDAMWGYRNDRFEQFGKFAARMDDVLNYIPARITALLYLIVGNSKQAWQAWRTQAKYWYSPNAGVVMATGAGALMVKLGGAATYHGKLKERPELGSGKTPAANDIRRAIRLIDYSVYGILTLIIIALLPSF